MWKCYETQFSQSCPFHFKWLVVTFFKSYFNLIKLFCDPTLSESFKCIFSQFAFNFCSTYCINFICFKWTIFTFECDGIENEINFCQRNERSIRWNCQFRTYFKRVKNEIIITHWFKSIIDVRPLLPTFRLRWEPKRILYFSNVTSGNEVKKWNMPWTQFSSVSNSVEIQFIRFYRCTDSQKGSLSGGDLKYAHLCHAKKKRRRDKLN